jgi:outer membrane protein OmpA-like peptidoglycan-associated protein
VSSIVQPRLWVSYNNGVASYSGLVGDEATRSSMIDALTRSFGAANLRGSIAVNSNVAPVAWLANLPAALDNLKIPGTQALFEDNSVSVGGLASDSDRDKLISKEQAILGNGVTFGALGDRLEDVASGATRTASAALAGLKPGYSANDVVSALNLSIINFTTGSAEIPSGSGPLLQDAAARIQKLPTVTVIEIDGYTDNVGDSNANLALSQRRADAVRSALIQDGCDPSRLVAKGYGQMSPVSANDTPEGRFRNRRIEYRVKNT